VSDKYLFVGDHADTLGGGRPVAPGDPVPASAVDPKTHPHDQHLLDTGALIEPVAEKKEARD
jgi:hypothetical protein